jgi:hypothetical protein
MVSSTPTVEYTGCKSCFLYFLELSARIQPERNVPDVRLPFSAHGLTAASLVGTDRLAQDTVA